MGCGRNSAASIRVGRDVLGVWCRSSAGDPVKRLVHVVEDLTEVLIADDARYGRLGAQQFTEYDVFVDFPVASAADFIGSWLISANGAL